MQELNEDTLIEQYMADTNDDIGTIKFINSANCTKEMVNYEDGDGWCALNLAARLNRYEVVDALIKKGGDVNHINRGHSMNPLMFAIYDGDYYDHDESKEDNLKTIQLLINAGTNLNYEKRFSAFTLACQTRKNEVVSLLLSYDINIDYKDEDGKTGLDHLREDENEFCIKLVEKYLLSKSLQKELTSNNNETKKIKM